MYTWRVSKAKPEEKKRIDVRWEDAAVHGAMLQLMTTVAIVGSIAVRRVDGCVASGRAKACVTEGVWLGRLCYFVGIVGVIVMVHVGSRSD